VSLVPIPYAWSAFLFVLIVALFLSSFFLEKNEAKKASSLSNHFASKGVRDDKAGTA